MLLIVEITTEEDLRLRPNLMSVHEDGCISHGSVADQENQELDL